MPFRACTPHDDMGLYGCYIVRIKRKLLISFKSCLCINFLLSSFCVSVMYLTVWTWFYTLCVCVIVHYFVLNFHPEYHIYFPLLVIQAIFKHVVRSSISTEKMQNCSYIELWRKKQLQSKKFAKKVCTFKFCPSFCLWCESVIMLNSFYCTILLIYTLAILNRVTHFWNCIW